MDPQFDIDVRYAVVQPDGEFYGSFKTRAIAESIANSKAGGSYVRFGWNVRCRILPTLRVTGGVGPFGAGLQFIGGTF